MLIPLGILAGQGGIFLPIAGYFAGGGTAASSNVIDKLLFATDVSSVIAATISGPTYDLMAFANSGVAGYVAGGSNASNSSGDSDLVRKISFPSDTSSTTTSLSHPRANGAAFANSGVAGYVAGGKNQLNTRIDTVEKFAFPSDSRSSVAATLLGARSGQSGFANVRVAGYVTGGQDGGGRVATVDKYSFPSDSQSNLGTGLTQASEDHTGFSNNAVAGYAVSVNYTTTVDKFSYPTDTKTTLAVGTSVVRNKGGGLANSGIAGYVGGGRQSFSSTYHSSGDKFAFPSDTRTTIANVLSVAKRASGFADSGTL